MKAVVYKNPFILAKIPGHSNLMKVGQMFLMKLRFPVSSIVHME